MNKVNEAAMRAVTEMLVEPLTDAEAMTALTIVVTSTIYSIFTNAKCDKRVIAYLLEEVGDKLTRCREGEIKMRKL